MWIWVGANEARRGQVFAALFFFIFICVDLRISISGAKFDAEADFDVRSAVVPPKPHQINDKLISNTKKSNFFRIVFETFWWSPSIVGGWNFDSA